MKKTALIIICALLAILSSCTLNSNDLTHDSSSGFALFLTFVLIAEVILFIVILVRWWKMTTNVEIIREHITPTDPKLTYLVAIGEKEQAQKAALKMIVDLLYPIYLDSTCYTKAETINNILAQRLPRIAKLGIELPDYVMSGEKFIDYLNDLTGRDVSYKDTTGTTYYSLR